MLKKTKYCLDDYLVVVGDFIEKGDQAIETVEYLMKLQEKNDKVYVLLGNCEYALTNYSFFIIDYDFIINRIFILIRGR